MEDDGNAGLGGLPRGLRSGQPGADNVEDFCFVCHRPCASFSVMKGQSKQPVSFINAALERSVVIRALKVTAVVGTLLVAINHGDVFVGGGEINWFKIILTYMVPYAVATYAAAAQMVSRD